MVNLDDRFRVRVTVGAVVERDGKILCVEENKKFPDDPEVVLVTPGGHLEPDESIINGILREVREETGYTVEPVDLIGVYQNNYTHGGPSIKFAFRANVVSEETVPVEDESVLRVLWVPKDELQKRRKEWRPGSTVQQLDDYFKDTHFPLDLLHYSNVIKTP